MKQSKVRRGLACLMAALMVISMVAPGTATAVQAAAKKYVKSVKVTSKVSVGKGKTKKVKVSVKATKGANKKLSIKVAKKKIVKASYNTKKSLISIKGLKYGKSDVTITTKGKNKKGKKIKRVIKVTVKKQTVAPTPSVPVVQPSTAPIVIPTPQPVIKVASITLSQTALTLVKGCKAGIQATIAPTNANNQLLSWKSSDTDVVTVTDGTIVAIEKGAATVTVQNPYSGVSASCKVTVVDQVTVTNQAELNAALAEGDLIELVIDAPSDSTLVIPECVKTSTNLIIKGNTKLVDNNGVFASISLFSENYIERARGNQITVYSSATIDIKDGAVVKLTVNDTSETSTVNLVNNGSITGLSLVRAKNVSVRGESDNTITTSISSPGVVLITSQNMSLSATEKAKLYFIGDTDKTTVTVNKEANKPEIFGTGTIRVTNSENNESENVVAAELDIDIPVAVTGEVNDYDDVDAGELAGVLVYLVPYTQFTAVDEIPADVLQTTTDVNGTYQFPSVNCGNYYIIMKAEGYKDAVQIVGITAKKDTYTNERMEMLKKEWNSTSSRITGKVINATDKEPVSGLTVEIRAFKGNVVGDPLKTTLTTADGEYSFDDLPPDQYTLYVTDRRVVGDNEVTYIDARKSICLPSDDNRVLNMSVSPSMKSGEVRFVLSWAAEGENVPEDLDSYLYGPGLTNGLMFYVNYSYDSFAVDEFSNTQTYAMLDTDCRDYSGPETITITKPIPGICEYYVHNYSENPNGFANSEAQVDVYANNQLVESFSVPKNGAEDDYWWRVCSYDSVTGQINNYNKVVGENVVKDSKTYISHCPQAIGDVYLDDESDPSFRVTDISDATIMISGSKNFQDIVEHLQYKTLFGYSCEYVQPDADNSYGSVKLKRGNQVLTTLGISYTKRVSVHAKSNHVADVIVLETNMEMHIYLDQFNSTILDGIVFECLGANYSCELQKNEDADYSEQSCLVGNVILKDNENSEVERYKVFISHSHYIKSMQSSSLADWYELSESVVIAGSHRLEDYVDLHMELVEGYTAAIEDGEIVIRNTQGEIVCNKEIDFD